MKHRKRKCAEPSKEQAAKVDDAFEFSPEEFFTPERLALIDESARQVDAGNFVTSAELKKSLDQAKNEWLRDHRDAK